MKCIKKVMIDPGCTSCGLCEFIAPQIFEVTDISHVKENAPIQHYGQEIKQAAAACPVAVIRYEEDKESE